MMNIIEKIVGGIAIFMMFVLGILMIFNLINDKVTMIMGFIFVGLSIYLTFYLITEQKVM